MSRLVSQDLRSGSRSGAGAGVRDCSARAQGRSVRGLVVGAVALAVAVAVLLPLRSRLDRTTDALVLLIPGVLAALVGGRRAAVVVSVAAGLAFNIGFLRPYGTLKVDVADEVIDLIAFVGVGLGAATLVGREADRRREAEAATEEIRALDRENLAIRRREERLAMDTQALELVDAQRSALLRAVSHDLRTPLATIRAVASDLRDAETYDGPTRNELLDLLADEAERLDRLVANLLSMSRIDAGRAHARPAGHRHRRAVRGDGPAPPADGARQEGRLRHAAHPPARRRGLDAGGPGGHEPARQHGPPRAGREPDRPRGPPRRDEWVRVTVADQGPGIPPSEREAVFTAFRTGAGSASSGIGLAIARAVVEAHGGTIAVVDGTGTGTTMAFTLPVHRG